MKICQCKPYSISLYDAQYLNDQDLLDAWRTSHLMSEAIDYARKRVGERMQEYAINMMS